MNTLAAQPPAAVDANEVAAFLFHEAELLDQDRFEEWMALFTPDGYYWAPVKPDQDDFLAHVSLFYDDRPMMQARILRLRHPRNQSTLVPPRCCRLVGNVRVVEAAPERCRTTSKLVMVESRRNAKRTFGAMVEHELKVIDGQFRIAWKKVVLVDCDQPFEELVVPF
jgi:3-phenylpropionate/cinnamic acid dioxygenase small subunit